MIQIPNSINVIWLGSFLRKEHQTRLIEWKRLNPKHTVNLWISRSILNDEAYAKFESFCLKNDIRLCEVETLQEEINVGIQAWLEQLQASEIKNYGVMSDIYRLYVLKKEGGWYFDTDITPVKPLPENLFLPYGFAIKATDDGEKVKSHSPSVLVSSPDSAFLQSAQHVVKRFAKKLFETWEPYVNSVDVLTRSLSTQCTTGLIYRAACSKLEINSTPLIYMGGLHDSQIGDYEQYKRIIISHLKLDDCFKIQSEMSWLVDEEGVLHNGLDNSQGLNDFLKKANKVLPSFCDDLMCSNVKALRKVGAIELSLEPANQDLPLAKVLLQEGVFKKNKVREVSEDKLSPSDDVKGAFNKR